MTVRKSVSSTPCVSWNSWMPVAPATPSSVTAPTGPCAAKMAVLTPTTARDEERSVWPRPSSPSSTRGPVVSGIKRRDWKWLLLCPSKPVVFFWRGGLQSPCRFLSLLQGNVIPPPSSSLCSFQAVGMSVLDLKCIWSGSAMRSEWMCVRAGGRGKVGGGASQSDVACVPSLEKLCLHFSTRSPPVHLLIPVMHRPVTRHRPHVSFIPSLFSPHLCCYFLCLFVSCVAVFLFKKKLFFLVAALQSVCLSVFVRLAIFLAAGGNSEATQWATSPGGFLMGEVQPPHAKMSCQEGSHTAAFIPLHLVSLCASLCHPFVFLFTLLQVMTCEVGEIFLFPCPPCFYSCLAHDALSSLLVSDSSQCVC